MTITTIGIIGAGQMGAGIAQTAAMSGFRTILWDANTAALEKGHKGIQTRLEEAVHKGKLSREVCTETLNRLAAVQTMEGLKDCDLAIEAVIENLPVKQEIFKWLDTHLPPHAILATNTSSISITKIAASTSRPDQCIGIHFMNPVSVMKLVEIIRGLQTSDATYEAATQVCAKLGKTTVLGIDTPGFIVNRILCPMINEAIFLVQEGVKPKDVDTAMKLGTNQPMGPLTLADFVGLDTLLYILRVLHAELGEDKYRPCPLLINYVDAGWFGKKSGRGFYTYP